MHFFAHNLLAQDFNVVLVAWVHVRVYIYASIGMSVSLIVFNAVNRYGLDVYEPVIMSVYLQICIILGVGQMMRSERIEDMDFDVYKEDTGLV